MFRIYIDSTDRYKKSVRLSRDGEIIDEISGRIDIIPSVKDLLDRNNLKIKQVKFAANPGPGSFTGIKIGITIANILNWTLHNQKIKNLQKPEYGASPNIHKTKWLE